MKQLLTLAFIAFLVANLGLNAQTNTSETAAFQESYSQESAENYSAALKALEKVSTDSYALVLRKAWLYYTLGDYGKSEAYYRKAIEKMPKSLEARFGLVLPLAAAERYADVRKVYEEIIEIDPLNSKASYWLAYSYYVQQDHQEAARWLKQLLEYYPFDYDANLLYGEVALKQGKIELARTHYFNALRYNPGNTDLQAVLEKL
jgi:tetratricopeptide (TPR) repeat protein